jgi:hypothetical protein
LQYCERKVRRVVKWQWACINCALAVGVIMNEIWNDSKFEASMYVKSYFVAVFRFLLLSE